MSHCDGSNNPNNKTILNHPKKKYKVVLHAQNWLFVRIKISHKHKSSEIYQSITKIQKKTVWQNRAYKHVFLRPISILCVHPGGARKKKRKEERIIWNWPHVLTQLHMFGCARCLYMYLYEAVLKGELTITMLLYACLNSHCHMLSECVDLSVTKNGENPVVHLSRHVCVSCVLLYAKDVSHIRC